MAEDPRYGFHPLERRGLLLGLDAGQLLTIAGGGMLAVIAHAALGGTGGVLAGFLLATVCLVGALWTRDGRPLGARAVTGAAWLMRRAATGRVDDTPTAGQRASDTVRSPGPSRIPAQRTAPPGIGLTEDRGLPGDGPLGVVRDRRTGLCAAVVPVGGGSFSLLDGPDQAQRLDGWRRVLGALARPGSPVVRVQWVQRSWSGGTGDLPGGAPDSADIPPAAGSYRALVEVSCRTMTHHQAWLVVGVRPSRHPTQGSGPGPEATTQLRRELRLLGGQLRDGGLDPGAPLDLAQLGDLISGPDVPGPRRSRVIWPMAVEDCWSSYRADDRWHATYWIAEWPRLEVGPDFLTPLLVSSARTTVAVVMAPVPLDRATREVRSARTADRADAELRARAGFLQSARRDRESEGVARREAELADGHHEFRFSGYVTVSAETLDQLTAACAAVEHAAQSAHIELRRLFGRQAEAYTWTLPLARGLR